MFSRITSNLLRNPLFYESNKPFQTAIRSDFFTIRSDFFLSEIRKKIGSIRKKIGSIRNCYREKTDYQVLIAVWNGLIRDWKTYHPFHNYYDTSLRACPAPTMGLRKKCFYWKTYSNMFFISVRNFILMGSNLKSWFQKLQKISILKRAALVILLGEEKIG